MTPESYVDAVIDHVPAGLAQRDQIAMELRSHIAERVAGGQDVDAVLGQLGDPRTLAESYLAAVPLRSAALLPRLGAKLIDIGLVAAFVAALVALAWLVLSADAAFLVSVACLIGGMFGFVGYTVVAEYREGRTLGKRIMGMVVVRESGTRIGLGQALVRQVPFFAQFYAIDVLFALFTDRRQRAFELLTKTRVVSTLLCIGAMASSLGWR
jgi:uncharacterized RDD family membrane protein YckC